MARKKAICLDGKKRCSTCKETKNLSEFHNNKAQTFGKHSTCKKCLKIIGPAHMRNYFMRIKYNLTIEKYDQLFENQNGVCKICKKPETAIKNGTLARLSVDHDHVTGAIRGLLCSKCNHGLGNFEDSIENLESAINT